MSDVKLHILTIRGKHCLWLKGKVLCVVTMHSSGVSLSLEGKELGGKGLHIGAQRPPAAAPPTVPAQASVPAFHLTASYTG